MPRIAAAAIVLLAVACGSEGDPGACAAEGIRDQLLAAGFGGSVLIFENDDAGSCP